jgi:hypothetical protein
MAHENKYEEKLIEALKDRPDIEMHADLANNVIQRIEVKEIGESMVRTRVLWFANVAFLVAAVVSILIFIDFNTLFKVSEYLPWIGVTIATIGGWTLVEKRFSHHNRSTI